jgi:SNF2 family DNA or RNA helicase
MYIDLKGKEAVFSFPLTVENISKARQIPAKCMFKGSAICFTPTLKSLSYVLENFKNVEMHPSLKDKLNEHSKRAMKNKDIVFEYKTQPLEHQVKALELVKERHAFGLLMEMGTGKTKVSIDDIAWQYIKNRIVNVVVLAPKGVHQNWVGELEIHMSKKVDYRVVCWRQKKQTALFSELAELQHFDGLRIICVNYEAMLTPKFTKILDSFIDGAMLILDESTRIKNVKAKVTKACLLYGARTKIRRILTGTPVTQGPIDLYSQFLFLDKTYLGFKTYHAFLATYASMKNIQTGGRTVRVIDKYINVDDLQNKIAPHSFRVTKAECLDLPPKIFLKEYHELSTEQTRLYKQMKDWLICEVEQEGFVSAKIVLTKILRLRQIIGGFIRTDDGEDIVIKPNPRLELLKDITENRVSGKTIIWSVFVQELRELKEIYGQEAVCYYGETGENERKEAIDRFQNDPSVRFFIGNPKAAGLGLTLTAASNVIYYSNSYSLQERLQSEDRAHRIGQSANKVLYFDLVAMDTVDQKIINALHSKKDLADLITGDNLREFL